MTEPNINKYAQVLQLLKKKIGDIQSSMEELTLYLKSWCKLISRENTTLMNPNPSVKTFHFSGIVLAKKENGVTRGFPPEQGQSQKNEKIKLTEPEAALVADVQRLLELLTKFSPNIIQSSMMPMKDATLLDNRNFLENLKYSLRNFQVIFFIYSPDLCRTLVVL